MNNQNIENIEDKISLVNIIDFFRESWKQIVLGGVIGGAIGVSIALIMPSNYQVSVYFQMAKIADIYVEQPSTLMEKLKIPIYLPSEIFIGCGVDKSANPGMAIINRMSTTLLKGTDIIKISYKDRNSDLAKKCTEIISNYIIKNQNEMLQPRLQKKKYELLILKQRLELQENFEKYLSTKNLDVDISDSNSTAFLELFTTLMINESENKVNRLREKVNNLEILLEEPQTKEGSKLALVNISNDHDEQKISPKAISSAIGGMVLVIVFLILRRGRTKNSRGFV